MWFNEIAIQAQAKLKGARDFFIKRKIWEVNYMLFSCKDKWIIFLVHLVLIYLNYPTYKVIHLRFPFTTISHIYILVWSHHKSILKSYNIILAFLSEALLLLTQQHITKNHVQRHKKTTRGIASYPNIFSIEEGDIFKNFCSRVSIILNISQKIIMKYRFIIIGTTLNLIFCVSFFLLVYVLGMIFILYTF